MAQKGEYKKNASAETVRQRKKNQQEKHKRKRVESARARRARGLQARKGNVGNTLGRKEYDHKTGTMIPRKQNRSQDNNKNHKNGNGATAGVRG